MELSVEEKFKRITPWIKELYADEAFPHCEMTEQIIDDLYQLAEYSEAIGKDFALLIEDMKQSAAEYEEKTNYLQGALKRKLGISLSSLSSEALDSIEVLANSAMTLDTKDTSLTSFFCAINDMTSETYEIELKNREMELELRHLKEKLAAATLRERQLEEDLKKSKIEIESEESNLKRRMRNIVFLEKKTLDLNFRSKAGEKKLIAAGLDQSLTHGALVSLSEKVSEDQKEVENLKSQVEPYENLCPSLPLAQVKIEELKRELNAVEEEFTEEVNNMFFKEV